MLPSAAGASDRIAELLVHGVITTLIVESLIRWVPIVTPDARLAHRVSALAAPLAFAVLFEFAVPFRREPWFQDASVFVSSRWDLFRVGGIGARTLVLWAMGALGAALVARDALSAALDALHERRARSRVPRSRPTVDLLELTSALARESRVQPPELELIDTPAHDLHLRGLRRPRIVVSESTLAALSPKELRAALAHEISHLAHRDVLWGWVLLLMRTLHLLNPFAQACGRRAVQEIEWRADDDAARITAAPLALARALVECARNRGDSFLGISGQGRFALLEQRCHRLMSHAAGPATGTAVSLTLLWIALGALLVLTQ
jgi:Zn-dependent protease with chaperone function